MVSLSKKLSVVWTMFCCDELIKILVHTLIDSCAETNDTPSSYHLKTVLFTSLKISITTFGIRRAYICLRICLTRLFLFVITGCCPNYFLHESNLFLKKNNYWEEIILILMASENNCIYMLPFVLEISCCIGTTIRVLCALHILFIIFSTWSGEGR